MNVDREFWLSSGHLLLDRTDAGGLVATDPFLKAYLARQEILPPADACAAERELHERLLDQPRRAVSPAEIKAIGDADARENWQVLLAFRHQLLAHRTLEAAYLDIVRRNLRFPHLFLHQIVHLILRNVLDGCDDPFVLRAAEMLFRPQRLTLHEGSLLAADEETIAGIGQRPLSPLVSMLGLPPTAEIDVLQEENADTYWDRSDRFDFALDLTAGRRGHAALAQVLTRWIKHLLGLDAQIDALVEMREVALNWYVGLDAEATRICNTLWSGGELEEADQMKIVGLFRLTLRDLEAAIESVRGEPVYLIAAMTSEKTLLLKPQNLITGLPLRQSEART